MNHAYERHLDLIARLTNHFARADVTVGKAVELSFGSETHTLLSPVTAEVYVTELLNREEFRAHCDRLRTRSAILSGLR
jgi:hypothetical protein